MAQPPPREGRLGHHSRDSCSNCHEDHQGTETDKQEECFLVHIVAFNPEWALGHVNQEPKWTNARKRNRLEPRIENECGGAWQWLSWQILRGAGINWHDIGGKRKFGNTSQKLHECEFGGAALLDGSARCEALTRQELADCSWLHTFRPIDIQLWQNQNETWNFWNLNQKIAHWNSDQSLVENVLYLDLVIESQ